MRAVPPGGEAARSNPAINANAPSGRAGRVHRRTRRLRQQRARRVPHLPRLVPVAHVAGKIGQRPSPARRPERIVRARAENSADQFEQRSTARTGIGIERNGAQHAWIEQHLPPVDHARHPRAAHPARENIGSKCLQHRLRWRRRGVERGERRMPPRQPHLADQRLAGGAENFAERVIQREQCAQGRTIAGPRIGQSQSTLRMPTPGVVAHSHNLAEMAVTTALTTSFNPGLSVRLP